MKSISNICLPPDGYNVPEIYGYVTGWGEIEYGGPQSSVLREVYLKVLADDECKRSYNVDQKNTNLIDSDIQLCAMNPKNLTFDSCKGDSGGPLIYSNNSKHWILVGLVSYGVAGCGKKGIPGVYTRVSSYVPWINSATAPPSTQSDSTSTNISNEEKPTGCGVHMKKEIKTVGSSQPAEKDEWPWMAALLREGADQYCGGVLITDQHVLTSSACVDELEPEEVTVRLGEYDFTKTDREKDFKVEKIIMHPDYNSTTAIPDIAVLKLKKKIKFTDSISPICLPPEGLDLEGKNGYVMGWYSTLFGKVLINVLLETLVPIWNNNNAKCKSLYSSVDTETQLCAGIEHGTDSCHIGDWGVPLMFQMENGQWTVAGVLERRHSYGCTNEGVFTRVSPYLQWIRRAILSGGCGVHMKKEIKTVGSSQPAEKDEWPWMAALLRERTSYYCGGVLITDQHILTSSRCIKNWEPEEVTVRLGEYDFTKTDRGEKDFKVEKIITHPDYNSTTNIHNIAVLKLKKKIKFTDSISPICLPPEGLDLEGKNGYVMGWESTSFGKDSVNVLLETLVPIWKNSTCPNMHGFDTKTMLCAGILARRTDSCHIGDWGGPLMFQMENGRWTLAGILTRRYNSCPMPHYTSYGVFTTVSPYLQWIRSAIAPTPLPVGLK